MDLSNKQEFVCPENFVDKTKKRKKMRKSKSEIIEDIPDPTIKYPEKSFINLDNFIPSNPRKDVQNNSFFNEYFEDYKDKNYDFYKEYNRGRYLPEAKVYFNRKKGKLDGSDYLYNIGNNIINEKQYYNDDKPISEGANFLSAKNGIMNSKGRVVKPSNYAFDIIKEDDENIEKANDYVNYFYLEPFERVVLNISNINEHKKIIKKKKIIKPKIPDFFKE